MLLHYRRWRKYCALIAGLHGSQCESSVQDNTNANYEIKVCGGGGGSDSRRVENFRVKVITRAPLVKTSVIVGRGWLIRQVGGGIIKRRNALSVNARETTAAACVKDKGQINVWPARPFRDDTCVMPGITVMRKDRRPFIRDLFIEIFPVVPDDDSRDISWLSKAVSLYLTGLQIVDVRIPQLLGFCSTKAPKRQRVQRDKYKVRS